MRGVRECGVVCVVEGEGSEWVCVVEWESIVWNGRVWGGVWVGVWTLSGVAKNDGYEKIHSIQLVNFSAELLLIFVYPVL